MHPLGRVMGEYRLTWKGGAAALMTSTLTIALSTWGLARSLCNRNMVSKESGAFLYRRSSRDRRLRQGLLDDVP